MTRDEWIVVRFDATPDVDDMCDLGEIAPQRDLDQHEDDVRSFPRGCSVRPRIWKRTSDHAAVRG